MGFGYAGTFLVVFLTHPGVVIPTMASAISKATAIPPEVEAYIPEGGFPPVLSGLWQVLCAYVLGLGGDKSEGLAWTMSILYGLFLALYVYFGMIGVRITAGV